MRTVIEIAINDLRQFLVDRGNLISLLLVPSLMTLIIGLVSGGAFDDPTSQLLIDIIDQDASKTSAQFIDTMRDANSSLVLCPMDNTAEDLCELEGNTQFDQAVALTRLESATTRAVIEIPADFETRVRAYQPVVITIRHQAEFFVPGYLQQAISAASYQVNGAVVASRVGTSVLETSQGVLFNQEQRLSIEQALYDRATMLWEKDRIDVLYEASADKQGGFTQNLALGLGQSVPGMGSMFVMFTVFGGMTALITERRQWTLQRLASMPISRAQLVGGKILARFSLGMLQYLVVFAVGLVLGINLGKDLFALILVAISFTLAVTALSFALGSWLENEAQASGFSLLLSLILAPLGGAWWPMENVPEFMRILGHVSPVAWAMDAYTSLIFENGSLLTVLTPVLVLLGAAALCFWIGVQRFQYD